MEIQHDDKADECLRLGSSKCLQSLPSFPKLPTKCDSPDHIYVALSPRRPTHDSRVVLQLQGLGIKAVTCNRGDQNPQKLKMQKILKEYLKPLKDFVWMLAAKAALFIGTAIKYH